MAKPMTKGSELLPMAGPMTKVDWIENLQQKLAYSDRDNMETCKISVVPRSLKKWNEDAYMPRVVSIGPRFNGREDLLRMEEVKIRCVVSLLHRGTGVLAPVNLERCSSVIWDLYEEVRACYVTRIELEPAELSNIILVDGCFLLELLLITKGLDSRFPSRIQPSGPAAEVLEDEDVLSDLMLFENQIPILVLRKLLQTLFPEYFNQRSYTPQGEDPLPYSPREEQRKREKAAEQINNLVLSVLGYHFDPFQLRILEAPHILDLVRFFVNRRTSESTTPSKEKGGAVLDVINNTTQTRQQHLKLKRCALRLLTSGVTVKAKLPDDRDSTGFVGLSCISLVWNSLCGILFKLGNILISGKHLSIKLDHTPEDVEIKGLDFHFKFEKGILEIEQLHITKVTKANWCNIIASEHQQKIESKNTSSRGGDYRGKFTWAALVFNGLICSEDDVQLLKDKKIVVDHLRMSNEELMEFFRKIALGVDHGVVDSSSYIQMVDDLNNFTKAFFIKRIWRTMLNSFTYRQEWVVRFMHRNYNFVATVISLLTIVQTVFAILAYYFRG